MSTAERKATPMSIAREAVQRFDSYDAQVAWVAEQLAEPDLRRAYVAASFRALAQDAVGTHRHTLRMTPRSAYMSPENAEGMNKMAVRMGIFDAYTVGGKRLGDCTYDDLMGAAQDYFAKAEGCKREGEFLQAVAKPLKGTTRTVRAALKERDVVQLRA